MYRPSAVVTSAAEVQAILGPGFASQKEKVLDHIDAHCRAWIERCPFVVISSIDAAGAMDVSPKGDPPGFVKVLDRHTLAVPDRVDKLVLMGSAGLASEITPALMPILNYDFTPEGMRKLISSLSC